MKVQNHNVTKRTRTFFREKSGSLIIHKNVPKNAESQTFISKSASMIYVDFQDITEGIIGLNLMKTVCPGKI